MCSCSIFFFLKQKRGETHHEEAPKPDANEHVDAKREAYVEQKKNDDEAVVVAFSDAGGLKKAAKEEEAASEQVRPQYCRRFEIDERIFFFFCQGERGSQK